MGAFYSGTDNNNDKSGIYYSAVIGKLTDTTFEYVIRFNLYEDKRTCKLDEVFEVAQKEVAVPKEWLDQVDSKSHSQQNFPSYVPGRSMWDNLRNPNSELPFGFQEVYSEDLRDPKGRGGHKNTKGKGNVSQEPDLGRWPYVQEGQLGTEDGDIFVAGPNDVEGIEILGVDVDSSELTIEIAEKYGKEAADSYGIIDDFLVNLEQCDEGLLDIINQCYALLSSQGQNKLATEGIH